MAATAEAPVADVAAATPSKQASASKQAEEPVPVVSSLASVYPDGKKKKDSVLLVGTGRLRLLLVYLLW